MYGTTSSVAIKVLYDDMKIAVKCETLNVIKWRRSKLHTFHIPGN